MAFYPLRSINAVIGCVLPSIAALSGECLRDEGLVWLIGAVVRVVAAALRSSSIALALENQLPLPRL